MLQGWVKSEQSIDSAHLLFSPQKNTCVPKIKDLWQERKLLGFPLELHMLGAQSSRTSNSIFLHKSLDQLSLQMLREMSG